MGRPCSTTLRLPESAICPSIRGPGDLNLGLFNARCAHPKPRSQPHRNVQITLIYNGRQRTNQQKRIARTWSVCRPINDREVQWRRGDMYRARLKGFGQVGRMLQAKLGRSGKQHQGQNSPNLQLKPLSRALYGAMSSKHHSYC